jgi:hypothetical protein
MSFATTLLSLFSSRYDRVLAHDLNLLVRLDRMFGQECKNKTRDLIILLVQGEMAGVKQLDFAIRQIALERLCTGSDERGIVPPPDHQSRWLVLAQPRLPRRIGRDICPVVVEQIGLDLALAWSRQVGVLVSPGVWGREVPRV